ncbi:Pex12 amino terminal region-domain-containing protein [Dichotomocladium elegans]|nr:Pex12 amino terminal region-domain-containing protein [Dichotomocladium elegans]
MEFMSALSSQEDGFRPSLFELDAQQKLRELLQPAVQYAVAIYAQRYPRFLITLVNNHEEFYAILMLLIERHYLKEWGASFAENFYGLKRVSSEYLKSSAAKFNSTVNGQTSTAPALSRSEINKSLLVLVGLPYIKCRLDLLYSKVSGGQTASLFGRNEQEEEEEEEMSNPETTARRKLLIRLTRLFRCIYPYINAGYYGANLAYNIAYMFGKTRYYTPWLHMIGLEIKRMSMADYRSYYEKLETNGSKEGRRSPLQFISGVFGKVIEFLKVLLPMSIFFYKFLEWWYSSEFARGRNASALGDDEQGALIPPPEKTKPDSRGTPVPNTPNTCPLCLVCPINNPTALPSGYVFCYTCVYRYVEEHDRCPVTWIKTERNIKDLTKVYADGSL